MIRFVTLTRFQQFSSDLCPSDVVLKTVNIVTFLRTGILLELLAALKLKSK